MEAPFEIGKVASKEDVKSLETLMGATEDEMGGIYGELTAGKSGLLRVLTDAEQPRIHAPKADVSAIPRREICWGAQEAPNFPHEGDAFDPIAISCELLRENEVRR